MTGIAKHLLQSKEMWGNYILSLSKHIYSLELVIKVGFTKSTMISINNYKKI